LVPASDFVDVWRVARKRIRGYWTDLEKAVRPGTKKRGIEIIIVKQMLEDWSMSC
jgi:hypothetical protein